MAVGLTYRPRSQQLENGRSQATDALKIGKDAKPFSGGG